jgi:hypothetical protein
MTTANIRDLEAEIERLVREHVAACKVAAATAVERGFDSARSGRTKKTSRVQTSRVQTSRSSKTSKPHRTAEELAELGEQFYAAVCAKPGETMRVLCADVGATPRELNRPMNVLKRDGRVRTVGRRYQTRYFPMAEDLSETK